MAKYVTDTEFKRLVRVCLDENMSSEKLSLLEDVDTLSLDELIESKAEDAALSVVRAAPIDKLGDVAQSLEGSVSISGDEPHKGVIQLPIDFERLVRFKMSSWRHALHDVQPPMTPNYEAANSEFAVYGTKDKPALFLVPSAKNGRDLCLEAFSAKDVNDKLDGCLYVATPKKEDIIEENITTPKLIISILGSGTAVVTAGGNELGSGAELAEDTEVSLSITPARGATPVVTLGSQTLTLTESDGTYVGSFTMPSSNVTLTINTGVDSIYTRCDDAYAIGSGLNVNTDTDETYNVIGYITSIDDDVSNGKQSFWMDDTADGGNGFYAHNAILPQGTDVFAVGMKVVVTGNIANIADEGVMISNGTVVILELGDDISPQVPPDYVDLGLDSGTLWATKNVGASTPEAYGNYFAWGEIDWKGEYSWSNYTHCNGTYNTLTKYCTQSHLGVVDNKTTLEAGDDVAFLSSGGMGKIPSRAQCEELFNLAKTTTTWTVMNGISGLLVTSKVNGNSIFLPAAGNFDGGNFYPGEGRYWTSDLADEEIDLLSQDINGTPKPQNHVTRNSDTGLSFRFSGSGVIVGQYSRNVGRTIRPVYVAAKPRGRKPIRIDVPSGVGSGSTASSGSTISVVGWQLLLGDRLLRPTIYYAAYLTALAVKDDSGAEKLLGIAKSLIEN